MGIVDTKQVKIGDVAAENIYSKSGQLIVSANSSLTRQMISHLFYYGVTSVNLIDGEVPNTTKEALAAKEEVEKQYNDSLHSNPEYIQFKQKYTDSVKVLEQSFNDIILKNTPIDEPNLITDTVKLFDQSPTTYSLFDTLHAIKEIDDSTYAHCINVAIISRLIGTWVNFNQEDLDHLTLSGLLHDIGKCKIPEDILLKPGKLTSQEYAFIKKHPEFGYDIIKDQKLDPRIKNGVLFHHERFDGSGYPYGLTGDRLGDFESIVSIADVYDAMTSNRCYRSALCPFDVIATFENDGLGKYNPKYILIFLQKIANSYVNSTVLLNTGLTARIILINNNHLTRPVVEIDGEFFDLAEHPDIYIVAIK